MILKTSDQHELYYETYGDPHAPPLLLLHGIGADHKMWAPQIEHYPSNGYFVITPDLRGHGKSSKVDTLSMTDWIRDLQELLDHLQIESCSVIGVSMGGVIAQQFAVSHPERVQALILCDTFSELTTFWEKWLGFSQYLGFHVFKWLGNPLFARLMASAYKPAYAGNARDYFYRKSLEADFSQLILSRKVINRVKLLKHLNKIKVPVLVLSGDGFGRQLVKMNQELADHIPGAVFKVLKGGMDPSNLVCPEAFDGEALPFLQEVAGLDEGG
ncbi:MAG: alpha/beta fold hydrolase [Bacillaceae bacterium]|nr:alpha/beta fold hydrolase [Bacillaceae bacterium]